MNDFLIMFVKAETPITLRSSSSVRVSRSRDTFPLSNYTLVNEPMHATSGVTGLTGSKHVIIDTVNIYYETQAY